ncbi:MAG: hypothetical protein QOF73_913, partial [Thermomicrobiales bacterium]|nr:hypothetical protein [Thermomicrobiales bacterium]
MERLRCDLTRALYWSRDKGSQDAT